MASKAQAIWVSASSNAGLPSSGDFSRLALRKVPITERVSTNICAALGVCSAGWAIRSKKIAKRSATWRTALAVSSGCSSVQPSRIRVWLRP